MRVQSVQGLLGLHNADAAAVSAAAFHWTGVISSTPAGELPQRTISAEGPTQAWQDLID